MDAQLAKYVKKVSHAKTKDELLVKLRSMDVSMAADGLRIAESLADDEFKEWQEGVERYQRGTGNTKEWNDKFIDLLIPPVIARMQLYLEGGVEDDLEPA